MDKIVTKDDCKKCNESMAKEIKNLSEKFDSKFNEFKDDIPDKIKLALSDFVEKLDKRYASKEIEVWVKSAIIAVVGIVFLAIIYTVINK